MRSVEKVEIRELSESETKQVSGGVDIIPSNLWVGVPTPPRFKPLQG